MFSTINIGVKYNKKRSSKAHPTAVPSPKISWQVMFLISAVLMIVGTVAYYVRSGCDQETNRVTVALKS